MMKTNRLIITLIVICASLSGCGKRGDDASSAVQSKYRTGEVWSYKTRPNEADSKITILKVESRPPLGNVVHVSIQGLRIKNPRSKEGFVVTVPFATFSEEAINNSVLSLAKENAELPDYKEAYEEWRQRYEENPGGVFTITLAEAVALMEKNMNR
jgi:hypothetical protein